MNYLATYDKLIETRRNRVLVEGAYYERHHVVMKSMGGTDDPENLVYLTAREHFIAHWLLWMIHKNPSTGFAFSMMSNRMKLSSRQYSIAREALSSSLSEACIWKKVNATLGAEGRSARTKAGWKFGAKERLEKINARRIVKRRLEAEMKKKQAIYKQIKPRHSNPVVHYSSTGEILAIYGNVEDANRKLTQYSRSSIYTCVKKGLKMYDGSFFSHQNLDPSN